MLPEYLKVNTATASSKPTSEADPWQLLSEKLTLSYYYSLAFQVWKRKAFLTVSGGLSETGYSQDWGFSKYLLTPYATHDQSLLFELQRRVIQRTEKPDRHETWLPHLGTQSTLAWPQKQASVHLSHFLFIAKVRCWLCSQAWKWASLFFSPFYYQ